MLPRIWKKQTIGNALVKVKIVSDIEGQKKVPKKDLLMRLSLQYFIEPTAVFSLIILIVSTANSYTNPESTNIERAVLTLASLILFPIVFVTLINMIAKKDGLPHNTLTKTHLELDK